MEILLHSEAASSGVVLLAGEDAAMTFSADLAPSSSSPCTTLYALRTLEVRVGYVWYQRAPLPEEEEDLKCVRLSLWLGLNGLVGIQHTGASCHQPEREKLNCRYAARNGMGRA